MPAGTLERINVGHFWQGADGFAGGPSVRLSTADTAGIVRATPATVGAEAFAVFRPGAADLFAALAVIIGNGGCHR